MTDKAVPPAVPPEGPEHAPPAKPPAALTPAPAFWSRTSGVILPLVAVAISLVVWFRTNQELDVLRESQRTLIQEVAALKKSPVLDLTGNPTKGAEDAVVILVEFSDYECPYCVRHFQQTMPQIEERYIKTGKIRYVFRDFPVDQLHPEAIRAHEAAQCAGEQGKFWDLHSRLFSAAGTHTPPLLEQRATEAGLDLTAYRACVASGRTTAAIRANAALAIDLGANGTPAFFVGIRDRATNQMQVAEAISGAQSFAVFVQVIDAVMKQAAQ